MKTVKFNPEEDVIPIEYEEEEEEEQEDNEEEIRKEEEEEVGENSETTPTSGDSVSISTSNDSSLPIGDASGGGDGGSLRKGDYRSGPHSSSKGYGEGNSDLSIESQTFSPKKALKTKVHMHKVQNPEI